MSKFLIVGLGNKGPQYKNTRHNIGFMFIDYLAESFGIKSFKSKTHGDFSEISTEKFSLLLLKPTTLMNLSGKALLEFKKYYNPDEIIVVHDDLDMPLGKVRIRYNNSDGGHNGLKSIRQYIGNEYWKLKIGIDRPALQTQITNYVLRKFSKDELGKITGIFYKMEDNFELLLFEKELFVQKVMNH